MSVYKEKQKLGELLCKIGLMNEDQVMQALLLQKEQGVNPLPSLKAGASGYHLNAYASPAKAGFATGGHSSPSLKARGFLAVFIKTTDGHGRVAALEIMVVTPAISNLIREAKTFQIPSLIQIGKKDGMQIMDQAILDLLKLKKISAFEASLHANNKSMFEQYIPKEATNSAINYGIESGTQGISPKKDINDNKNRPGVRSE